jgi:hypothetical protein
VYDQGIHVPLSLGAPHEVKDKKGVISLAFDVAVNTKVVEDCKTDKTGAFRNFVCELAIEYIDQKVSWRVPLLSKPSRLTPFGSMQYKIKLDDRYKLPRLTYRGELPPPKHYIRKTQAPVIQEVAANKTTKPRVASSNPHKLAPKTATAHYEVFEERNTVRTVCSRLPSVAKGSAPLSPEALEQAGTRLIISIRFENEVKTASDVGLELQAELLSVKAATHHDLGTCHNVPASPSLTLLTCLEWLFSEIFLPYPVDVDSASARLDPAHNTMEMSMAIDKSWRVLGPDVGSAPWLLAQALNEDDSEALGGAKAASPAPKSLVEMFHLANAAESNEASLGGGSTTAAPRWDPVLEDEELPEDRFHRKDMMSMHILEQRRVEREQKAKESEVKRKQRRTEVEEMQKKAQEAGKSWREMYPNEPETTYIDMEDIVRQEKERLDRHQHQQEQEEEDPIRACMATEDAKRAAAKWSENKAHAQLDLTSALAFDLL